MLAEDESSDWQAWPSRPSSVWGTTSTLARRGWGTGGLRRNTGSSFDWLCFMCGGVPVLACGTITRSMLVMVGARGQSSIYSQAQRNERKLINSYLAAYNGSLQAIIWLVCYSFFYWRSNKVVLRNVKRATESNQTGQARRNLRQSSSKLSIEGKKQGNSGLRRLFTSGSSHTESWLCSL